MKNKILDDGVFLHLDRKSNGAIFEFILNKGFSQGVFASENYHFHSSFEVHICVKGELHILVEDNDIYLSEGDAIILPPGAVHYVFESNDSFRISYRYKFSSRDTKNELVLLFSKIHAQSPLCIVRNTAVYEKYLSVAQDNLACAMPDFCVSELLFLATYEIVRSFVKESGDDVYTPAYTASSRLAERIEEFFNANYTSDTSLCELAEHLCFSTRHTERILDGIFGMSFIEILNKKRLETAKLLLRTTDESVGEIAERVGFPDRSYFNKRFTALYGISASEYRKLHRIGSN